jgi:hypothetical protein
MTWLSRIDYLDAAAELSDDLLLQQEAEAHWLYSWLMGEVEDDDLAAGHPSVWAWTGYEPALAAYVAAHSIEAARRGYSTLGAQRAAGSLKVARRAEEMPFVLPPWHDDLDVLRSHRSNMMRRWRGRYSWAKTPTLMPYLWPKVDEDGGYVLLVSKHDKALLASGERTLAQPIRDRIENLN